MRLYSIRGLVVCICFIFGVQAYSQTITISGATQVSPGSTVTYTVTAWGYPPDANTQKDWNVSGGTILSQSGSSCQVLWDNVSGTGSVAIIESETNLPPGQSGPFASGIIYIQIGNPTVTVSPASMSLIYGNLNQQSFTAIVASVNPVSAVKWQSLTGSTWADISPAETGYSYTPPSIAGTFRCVAVVSRVSYYSNAVTASFTPLDPGIISLTQQPAYGGIPTITTTGSSGGMCIPNNRTYTWEASIDGQPWMQVGTGINYPSSALITGNTVTRRKVTCAGVTATSNILSLTPGYTSVDHENQNYIRVIEVHSPLPFGTWPSADQLAMESKSVSTTYLDGLGRPMQKVAKGASFYNSAWADLVQPIVCDAAGRTIQKYLPYPSTDNPGKFKSTNILTQQASFVTGKFGEPAGAPTYSKTDYDNSPLNRVTEVYSPGQSWGGSSIGVKSDYDFNDSTENVHIWSLAYTATAIPTTSLTAVYPTGVLYKSIVTDEKLKQVITYTDLSGNVILKKVQEKNDAGSGLTNQHAGWVCTYYIYDDFNQLRFTIPPKAVTYLDANNWNLTQQLVDDLCFVYAYDTKGRSLSKKQPGIAQTDVVYDQQDRPVFTQDGNGRQNHVWQGVLYDGSGRTTTTGVLPQAISTADLQNYVDNHSGTATISTIDTYLSSIGGGGITDLIVSARDYTVNLYTATNSITFNPGFTTEPLGYFTTSLPTARIASSNEIVTIADQPAPMGFIALTQRYYDNYSQIGTSRAYTAADNSLKDPATSSLAMNLPIQPSPQTRGFQTISKVKIITNPADLTQGNWIETDSYYNDQGLVIQTQRDNELGGMDIISNWLDFAGLPWGYCLKHRAGNPSQFTIVSRQVYDRQGKLTDLYKNFNNTFSKHLASYSYDEYGKMKNKTLAPGYTGSGKTEMENLSYDYNIQGWLTGINKTYAMSFISSDQWTHFFGLYLGYDNRDNQVLTPQYNGSIASVIWKSQGDNSMRKYDYTYDNLGRLTQGSFHQRKLPSDPWLSNAMDLSEYISYEDGNGNIHSMKHLGAVPGMAAGTIVDDLIYTYGTPSNRNVNKLSYVHDGTTLPGNGQLYDFKDGTNAEAAPADYDYDYDVNGNLVRDLNKGISNGGVIYNYLNKPVTITTATRRIDYVYDATGAKLSKKVTDLTGVNPITTTQYSGEFIYQDLDLKYIMHEEGRVQLITSQNTGTLVLNAGTAGATNVTSGKDGVFEYFIKDQLGNTRMVLTEEYQKEVYAATMETANASYEEKVFGKVDPNTGNPTADNELVMTRVDKISTPWSGNASDKVSELTASVSNKKVGPNLILKVSAGDVISAASDYFYFTNDATGPTPNLTDVLAPLIATLAGNKASPLTKANSSLIQSNLNAPTGDFAGFFNNQANTGLPSAPKAFLNVVFFDEQFNFIPGDPNAPLVGTQLQRVSLPNNQAAAALLLTQKAPKNGWVYIYLSNESNQSVYFDNLKVSQEHGRISEENHYYAFGQKIAGICTRGFKKAANSFNYQGEYSEEEENTLWNEFDLRMYDPQIGRWTGADPYDQFASPYIGMGNDPVNNVDPDGGVIGPELGLMTTDFMSFMDSWMTNMGYLQILAPAFVTPLPPAKLSVLDKSIAIATIAKHYLWDSWSGAGSEWGRRALIRIGGVEYGVIHGMTLGLVPSKPVFSQNYSEEDLDIHNGAAQAGQIIPSLFERPGMPSNSYFEFALANGRAPGGVIAYDQVTEIKRLLSIVRLKTATSGSPSQSSTSPSNGETSWTKQGRDAHNVYNPGDDYLTDRTATKLDNGTYPDAIDFVNRIIRELKPNNPRAIARGLEQAKKYARQLAKQRPNGGTWRIAVDTYESDGAGGFNYNYGTLQEVHLPGN